MLKRTLLLALSLSFGLNAQEVKQEVIRPKSNKIANTAKFASNTVKFIYNNSGRLLSKNTLATVMILGAPYIYLTDSNILSYIATGISDMTFKISDAAMSGMLRAAYNNKVIVGRLSSIFATKFIAAEAAKTGISEGIKYGSAVLGSLIRGWFGWYSMNELSNTAAFVKAAASQ